MSDFISYPTLLYRLRQGNFNVERDDEVKKEVEMVYNYTNRLPIKSNEINAGRAESMELRILLNIHDLYVKSDGYRSSERNKYLGYFIQLVNASTIFNEMPLVNSYIRDILSEVPYFLNVYTGKIITPPNTFNQTATLVNQPFTFRNILD